MNIPDYVSELMDLLNENGYECYIVGGAIRSALLNLPIHDYDLTTSALPADMKRIFNHYKTIDTGIEHGTVTVLSHHMPVEITTYRKDSEYQDHRHPDTVTFTPNIKEDCARRDFTVNAFCYNRHTGLLDFFNGKQDIENHVIRCIGIASKRFDEDALRILRAIRFASQLNFTIESETSKALHHQKELLRYVSAERIHEEFAGFLAAAHCADLMQPYRDVFEIFLPELADLKEEEFNLLIERMDHCRNDSDLRMALILSTSAFKQPGSVLKRMKYANVNIRKIKELLQHRDAKIDDEISLKYLLKSTSVSFEDYISYRQAMDLKEYPHIKAMYETLQEQNACYSLKQLGINGQDAVKAGYKGKEISEVLDYILNQVIENKVPNNREMLLHILQEAVTHNVR